MGHARRELRERRVFCKRGRKAVPSARDAGLRVRHVGVSGGTPSQRCAVRVKQRAARGGRGGHQRTEERTQPTANGG